MVLVVVVLTLALLFRLRVSADEAVRAFFLERGHPYRVTVCCSLAWSFPYRGHCRRSLHTLPWQRGVHTFSV